MEYPKLLARHVERRPCAEHGYHHYNIEIWNNAPGLVVQRVAGGHDTKPVYTIL